MDINNMRNIVILKNLPSNLIEEAFVVLKKNQKIKKMQLVENKKDNFSIEKNGEEDNEYVIKEAELLLSDYINKFESKDLKQNNSDLDLMRKYKKLKKISIILGCLLVVGYIYFTNLI